MSEGRRRFGPGFVITAAFIGPGTVITCTASGAQYGSALIWALIFAGLTTIVLQEMAVRMGLATGKDLATNLREVSSNEVARVFFGVIAAGSIAVGCAAYQAGNLAGGAAGISVMLGGDEKLWVLLQAAIAAGLLWTGSYAYIEKILMTLVALMGLCFVVTAVIFAPALAEVFAAIIQPTIPDGAMLNVLALIGTTVVPYNLFLHSRIVGEKWRDRSNLGAARWDLLLAVAIGVAASVAIMLTAAGALAGTDVGNISGMARPLRSLLGPFGSAVFGIGLWAAGMTSAITAPLASAYTVAGASGWGRDHRHAGFRAVWIAVLATGVVFVLLSARPVPLIVAAQALNGIILPFAAVFMLILMNRKEKMGELANRPLANVIAVVFLLVVAALSARYILGAVGLI